MIKISEEQAIKMAYGTIMCDYDDAKRKSIVKEIIENWKYNGYIEGYEKQEIAEEVEQNYA